MSNTVHDPWLDQFISRPEAAAARNISVATLNRMIRNGDVPPPVKLSPRRQGWRRRDILPQIPDSA
jgi:predicted DNA-binding transcriptional regulator AlpA